MAEALITYLPKLLAKVPQLITSLVNKFLELCSSFNKIGEGIIDGIWSGISAGWDWLVGKVKSLADNLFEAAKDALDINSPSKKFEWLADMCIAGWDNEFDDFMNPDDMVRNINASFSAMRMQTGGTTGGGDTYLTVNVNKEVATADELARAIRVESRYGLIQGEPIGTG